MSNRTHVGQLCADDIGATEIMVRHQETTIGGLVENLDLDVSRDQAYNMGGRPVRTIHTVHVAVTIGTITLDDLPRDHPMEVIS